MTLTPEQSIRPTWARERSHGDHGRLPETCPICRGAGQRVFETHGYWIRDCETCQHRFAELAPGAAHVAEVYSNEYFTGGGAGYADYISEGSLLRERGRRYGQLLARHMRPGRVLDVGAAGGFLLQGLMDLGWVGRGLEPNPSMVRYARSKGLDVRTGTLEAFDCDERFDLVFMVQVVAHFTDPCSALDAARRATRPGGSWLIECWNRESLTARALGRHWHEYSPPSVLHWFSPAGLERLAAQFGFVEVDRGRPVKRIAGGHARLLLEYGLAGSALGRILSAPLRLIPDRLQIPYPAEDLFWALFRRPPVET